MQLLRGIKILLLVKDCLDINKQNYVNEFLTNKNGKREKRLSKRSYSEMKCPFTVSTLFIYVSRNIKNFFLGN